jgi:hypothetical protein
VLDVCEQILLSQMLWFVFLFLLSIHLSWIKLTGGSGLLASDIWWMCDEVGENSQCKFEVKYAA